MWVERDTSLMSPNNNAPGEAQLEFGTKPNDARKRETHVGDVFQRNTPPKEVEQVINALVNLFAVAYIPKNNQ